MNKPQIFRIGLIRIELSNPDKGVNENEEISIGQKHFKKHTHYPEFAIQAQRLFEGSPARIEVNAETPQILFSCLMALVYRCRNTLKPKGLAEIDCIALVFSWLSKVKCLAESGGRPPNLLKVRKAASDTKDSGAAGKNNELERS